MAEWEKREKGRAQVSPTKGAKLALGQMKLDQQPVPSRLHAGGVVLGKKETHFLGIEGDAAVFFDKAGDTDSAVLLHCVESGVRVAQFQKAFEMKNVRTEVDGSRSADRFWPVRPLQRSRGKRAYHRF